MVDMQWRVGLSGYTGLDASACHRDFEMAGVTVTPEQWDGIKVMAKAALNAWAASKQ